VREGRLKPLVRIFARCAAVLALVLSSSSTVNAENRGAWVDAGENQIDGSPEADVVVREEDPAVVTLVREAQAIRALAADQIEPVVDPATLFEVPLADDDAIRVDAARLRLLLREVDEDSGAPRAKSGLRGLRPLVGDGGGADAEGPIDSKLWAARIDLDRARLAFYELPAARRREVLAADALRQSGAAARPSEAELRERAAEQQRQVAIHAAQTARTDAERLVSSELARLLGVDRAQSAFDAELAGQERQIAEQRDVTVGWQQRALDAQEHAGSGADAAYDDLRRALRSARDGLSDALDELTAPSGVPEAGPDGLADLTVDVDTGQARKERERVVAQARRLDAREEDVRLERAAALFDEIDTLNHERLALLDSLSPAKRGAVTGFTAAGWDQAASEARQLTLILRYHRHVIGRWVSTLRHPDRALAHILAGGALQLFEWLLAIGGFAWWRRRSTPLLAVMHHRAQEDDRRRRLPAPSPATRALAFFAQVHRPIEWLALLFVLKWFLPPALQQPLEVRVLSVLMTWIFGAALVVEAINAVAGSAHAGGARPGEQDTAALRLRSLRLMGRVVVAFGLILVISAMLVGRGTIFRWVLSTCWLASIPVILVLVRWWRDVVFRRIDTVRRPSRIQRWVLAHRHGWTSFTAATVGGSYLFASGALRGARNWTGRFVITRHALAYLFRRQLGKLGQQTRIVGHISDAAFESLGPERPPVKWIANDANEGLERLARRIRERRGGVIALVGERGMGKTSALRRLRGEVGDSLLIDAPSGDRGALRARIAEQLGGVSAPEATLQDLATALSRSPGLHALLIDNAQRFVKPVMGGLAEFDALIAVASRNASTTTWVFALDEVVWRFLSRARDGRPLFDEVVRLERWTETQIVSLLQTRTEEAALVPSFESLLEPLPATADEIDKQEALRKRASDYFRLLWDSAMGNPGVAMHMWRCSLGTDNDGQIVVRPFMALDTTDLERLPDPAVFVLRAVLQLAPASAEHVASGTMIPFADVADALRYAASRGYVEEHDVGYRITWTWFRAITTVLQRKHLLAIR
jgi:hypothetical protein